MLISERKTIKNPKNAIPLELQKAVFMAAMKYGETAGLLWVRYIEKEEALSQFIALLLNWSFEKKRKKKSPASKTKMLV